MKNLCLSPAEAASLIRTGVIAVFAGSEDALRSLPAGTWIGGTSPYFMTEAGGVVDTARLFCTVLTGAVEARTVALTAATLPQIVAGRFANGFSYVLIPAFTEVHRTYALDGPGYPGLCNQPVMGWVTGVLLSELGSRTPKVFDGMTGAMHDNAAVVMHVRLPAGTVAQLDFINLFAPGTGPKIAFPADGFSAAACTVDGVPANFAQYVTDNAIDTKLPLVADYAGASVNVSIQAVDQAAGTVAFYAPVLAGETYRFARAIEDYADAYAAGAGDTDNAGAMLACNCILNFLYAELEGKTTGGFVGPVTFGEIAYVLLNQTLVRLQLLAGDATPLAAELAEAV
jgi:hypothetical protein